jgi:hypothetical protein
VRSSRVQKKRERSLSALIELKLRTQTAFRTRGGNPRLPDSSRAGNPHSRNGHRILSTTLRCKMQQNKTKGNKRKQKCAFIAHQKRTPPVASKNYSNTFNKIHINLSLILRLYFSAMCASKLIFHQFIRAAADVYFADFAARFHA